MAKLSKITQFGEKINQLNISMASQTKSKQIIMGINIMKIEKGPLVI